MARHSNIQSDNPLARYKAAKDNITDAKLAAQLGLAREQVQKLRAGKRGPSLATALKIQERTNGEIPVTAWGNVAA